MRNCPVVAQETESRFPGPRSLAIDQVRWAREPVESMDELLLCSTCHRCEEVCPASIHLTHAMLELRRVNRSAYRMRPGHERMVQNIDHTGFSVEIGPNISWPSTKEGSELCYFPGCIATWKQPGTARSAVEVLSMFDHPVHVPPGLRCCGSPMEKIGDEVRRTALVEENRTHLRHFSRVVSSCPGCTAQLIDRYGIDAMHIVEYLYEVIGTKKISRSAKPRSLKVALHHPCHLNRIIGPHTKDYAISLVQALPGVVLIDTSDSESCCGAGGSLLSGYPEVASRMALEKVRNASTSGAELLVAACPFCVTNLGRAGGIEVMDLTDLIHDFVLRA